MKRLSISLPDEAYDRLVRKAEEDRRSVASAAGLLVERALDGFAPVAVRPRPRPVAEKVSVPVGGQDAAAGKGVEERQEDEPVTAGANVRPRDHVVIGGPDCTHPARFALGRRCEAPGCGKVVGR